VKTIPLLLLALVLAGLTATPQDKELWPKWDKGKVQQDVELLSLGTDTNRY
jgi:hypothetical protein